MSFICQECKRPQAQGEKPHILVTEIRKVTYIHHGIEGNPKSEGWEIIKAILVCNDCYQKYQSQNFQPKVVEKVTRIVRH
jgi:protein-arginine kinase activator protein McsA